MSNHESINEAQLWQEFEQRTGDMIRDWTKVIKTSRLGSRESLT